MIHDSGWYERRKNQLYLEKAIDEMSSRYMQGDREFDAEYQELLNIIDSLIVGKHQADRHWTEAIDKMYSRLKTLRSKIENH